MTGLGPLDGPFPRSRRRIRLAKLEAALESLQELEGKVGREKITVQGAISIVIQATVVLLEAQIEDDGERPGPEEVKP